VGTFVKKKRRVRRKHTLYNDRTKLAIAGG
jgi:hypothetical protein